MEHRICEDHECKGLLKTDKIKQEQKLPTINTEIVIKAPKKNNDPIQQARIDKVAAMRLKAKNTFKIPLSDAIIVFVNPQNSDRFPCMISKDWTVNRCKSVIVEQSGLKDPTSYTLYSEEETLLALKLDDKVGNCLKDMQDVHLLVNQT
jgi:DNA-directed RNA polymerase subunit H (RpoH/RPB5)